jgi:translocation and assembly module TamB
MRGETELHAWLKGPLKRPERLEAHLEIPTFKLGYKSVQIANAAPIRIDYRAGTVTMERAELKGTGNDLHLTAIVPVRGEGTVHATATGNLELRILQLLSPTLESSGQVKLDVGVRGTRTHPEMHGLVQVIDGAFQTSEALLGAEKVNAKLELQKDRVDITSFTAQMGGGTVTAQGFVAYEPAVRFNVTLSGKEVRLRYPEGVRAILNSNLALNGTPESASLTGQVLIDRLSFTEAFDLASFADQFTEPSSPPSEGITRNIKLDVALKSTQEMGLSNNQLSLQGTADLQVRGTVAEPVILGRTNVTGGELFFNDRRYQVQNGLIQFVNPVRTEPVMNLSATTTVDQFNISLNFIGPIDRLRTSYTSDPPLPPVDVINLLFTGKTTEAAAASPSTPQSVVAGQLAGQVSSRVGKLVGISSLTVDPQIGSHQSNPGARLAIQQRVTKNLFFTFATDVTSSQGQVVQVEYQVTRKYSLSAVRNQNGGYSLQAKIRKRF